MQFFFCELKKKKQLHLCNINNCICFHRNHYTQHRAAVDAARQGKTGRLETFNTADTQSIVPAEDICGLCEG